MKREHRIRPEDEMRRPPGRGPSGDQPAPSNPRFIPARSKQPPDESVTCVTILEQDPALLRWESTGEHRMWVQRGPMSLSSNVWDWSQVGKCHHGTYHDLKDVTEWRRNFPGNGRKWARVQPTGDRVSVPLQMGRHYSTIQINGTRYEVTPEATGDIPVYEAVGPADGNEPQ